MTFPTFLLHLVVIQGWKLKLEKQLETVTISAGIRDCKDSKEKENENVIEKGKNIRG